MKITRRIFLQLFLAIGFTFFVGSCKKDDVATPANQNLVSGTLVKEYSKSELLVQLNAFGGAQLAPFLRSGIKQYKIIYKTKNTDGTTITASGGFILPTTLTDPISLVSYQHGTITSDALAPSYFDLNSEAPIGSLISALGYFVVMPDYIGYGESKSLPHTYEHRVGLATASLDLIRAAKEFIKDNNLNWNSNLLIAGYSEGGYATMALQKKIEDEFPTEFNLKASSCGSGAYNKTLSFMNLVSKTSSGAASSNSLYIWVLLTYDRIYKLNRPMSAYFKEPYATQIDKDKQNAQISVSLDKIIADNFKTAVVNGTDAGFAAALKDNDIFDWKPKTPTQLYAGDADELVGYFNSKTAFDAMKARGAASLEFKTTTGGTHGSTVSDFLLGTFSFFSGK